MTDQDTISVYDAQFDAYKDLVSSGSPDPWLLEFIARVKTGGYVLDLGCGPADASQTMREHGLSVDPVDASAEMVRLANESFAIGARQASFSDIDCHEVYDGVWANFSLLHASREDFPGLVLALAQSLKPGAIFSIGMKTGSGSERDKIGRFYTYYTEAELNQYLQSAGLEINHRGVGKSKGLAGSIDPWITLMAVKS